MAARLVTGIGALLLPVAAAAANLSFHHQELQLGAAPVALLAVDLDGDGRRALVAITAGTGWGEIGYDEPMQVDASGTLVDVLTVVPALLDRRTAVVFRDTGDGWRETARADLPPAVHLIEPGPKFAPLLAWTDDGVAALRWGDAGLVLEPLVARPTLFAGSEALFPPLGLAVDLDADGERDLLVPGPEGLAVYLAADGAYPAEPTAAFPVPLDEPLPGDARHYRQGAQRHYPLPVARDLDGDGLPELLFRNHQRQWNQVRVVRNLGGGRFAPPVDPLAGRPRDAEPEVVFLGDLDGDGRADVVTSRWLNRPAGSLRQRLAAARRPRFVYAVHALGADLRWDPRPRASFELEGHVFTGEDAPRVLHNPRDLDGDGRPDLVALRLDLSLADAARVLLARSLRVGVELAAFCQDAGGAFRPTATLTGELKVRLAALRLAQAASFGGDFDGDGRADFLRLGPGRRGEVHLGRPGCRYGTRPDLRFDLVEAPQDAALVNLRDLDGDGRSDVAVTRVQRGRGEADVAAVIDLYLAVGAP
jgi:hypothetical protein